MPFPLPVRALWRGPITQAGYAVRRCRAWWTPALRRHRWQWAHHTLSPGEINTTVAEGMSPAADGARVKNQNLLGAAEHLHVLTPALVRWCVTQQIRAAIIGHETDDRVAALRRNPALTDRLARVAQEAIEECLWRDTAVRRVLDAAGVLLFGQHFCDCRPNAEHACVQTISWVHLQRSGAGTHWPPFLRRMIGAQLDDGPVLSALADAPDVPDDLLRAVWNAARTREPEDGAAVMGRLCHRTPCPVSVAECRDHIRWQVRTARAEYFAQMPTAFRRACWSVAYAGNAGATIRVMGEDGSGDWPGLTEAHLTPLFSAEDAGVRLAAIQLLAHVAPVPAPQAPSGVPPSGISPARLAALCPPVPAADVTGRGQTLNRR